MLELRRRNLFTFVVGAMVALPRIAWPQSGSKIPGVGYLWHAGTAKEEHPYQECPL